MDYVHRWTNGEKISHYHRKDPNYFEDITDIPKANQSLKDILSERFTLKDLIIKDKITKERKSLKDIILEMEDEVLANAGVDVFGEVLVIFIQLVKVVLDASAFAVIVKTVESPVKGFVTRSQAKWLVTCRDVAAFAVLLVPRTAHRLPNITSRKYLPPLFKPGHESVEDAVATDKGLACLVCRRTCQLKFLRSLASGIETNSL